MRQETRTAGALLAVLGMLGLTFLLCPCGPADPATDHACCPSKDVALRAANAHGCCLSAAPATALLPDAPSGALTVLADRPASLLENVSFTGRHATAPCLSSAVLSSLFLVLRI